METDNGTSIQVSSLLSSEPAETPNQLESQEPQVKSPETAEPPSKKLKAESPEAEVKTESVIRHKEPPVHEMVGGSSVRQYLNKHLTKHLLEGLKVTARNQPEDPLRELGEFLIARSQELKGGK